MSFPNFPAGNTGGFPDLPAGNTGGFPDLPAGNTGGFPDLPAGNTGGFPDLPAGNTGGFPGDLPTGNPGDLPPGNIPGGFPDAGLPSLPNPSAGGFPDIPDFPDFDLNFEDIADFGIDSTGSIDLESFNVDKVPSIGEDGFYPLSGKDFPGFPSLNAPGFNAGDFSTFPADFDVSAITLDFAAVPALLGELAKIIEGFTKFAPSPALFSSFTTEDFRKVEANLQTNLKELLSLELDADKVAKLAKAMAEKIPSRQEIEALGIAAADADKIDTKANDLVAEFGNINFFSDQEPADILVTLKDKLDIATQEDLKAGLPDNMELDSFVKLTNKAGFDTTAFKQLLADPSGFQFNGRSRRNADTPAAKFAKQQVTTQAELAVKQNEEKSRQDVVKSNGATTIAISTISIAASALAALF